LFPRNEWDYLALQLVAETFWHLSLDMGKMLASDLWHSPLIWNQLVHRLWHLARSVRNMSTVLFGVIFLILQGGRPATRRELEYS
jgi:hypothetical protein